jgi:hypothetical protein
MSTRERFPNRRASTIFDFEAMGMRFTASASRYDDGRFAELFLDNHKAGSSIGTLVRDCAIVLSFSLQHGADPPRLVSRQRRPAARPACRCARPAREGAATVSTMPIAAIKIGKRHRHDMGDIEALAADIAGIGMLHPIVVRPDGKLIAGERRLRAAQMLGWKKIAVTVIDLTAVVRGEFAENAHRKDFTLSEAVAIKRALEPLERAAAKQRQGRRTDKHPEKFSGSSKGRALDKVAAVAGMHRTTIAKAEAVVDAAAAEPERFANLLADMDRTGKVNGPFKRLGVLKQAAAIRAEPPPARGP